MKNIKTLRKVFVVAFCLITFFTARAQNDIVGNNIPEAGNLSFELYPNMLEYTNKHLTDLANLDNGDPATGYVAMFDEYDEGTAIAKAAKDTSMISEDQYFLTLDADDIHCSSDFYLRLTGDGVKMIKGQIALIQNHLKPHTIPVSSNGDFLDDCDELAEWNNGLDLNSIDTQEGNRCLEYIGTKKAEFFKTFEAWFDADNGQTVNSIQLKGIYNTVGTTFSLLTGNLEYDAFSENSYNKMRTATSPISAPEDRYDLIVKPLEVI